MFESRIIHKDFPAGHRVFVTGDIHGNGHYLRALLQRVDFGSDDILIIVGDMLEKGPDSLGTLRYVMSLCEGGNVYPLTGNVDAFALSHMRDITEETAPEIYDIIHRWKAYWGSTLYHEMAAKLGLPLNSPADALACKPHFYEHFSKEIAFLEALPAVLETDHYIFVHGGLRRKEPDDNADLHVYELTKYDDFVNTTPFVFDKIVIVGHWPVILYREGIPSHEPFFDPVKRIISIDGGCGIKEDGQLNLLCLPDIHAPVEAITWERYDELPVVTALEDQSPSEDPLSITWHTRQVTILEKGGEFTRVRHDHSGRELSIPTAYFYRDTEVRDYTDYHLPVKAGDRLSVTHTTSRGIIAKKDGIVGWYCGKYE